MMASRKSDVGVQRPKQAPKKGGMMQFALVGVGVVALIIIALLLFGGGGKKRAAPRTKTASADEGTTKKPRKSPSTVATTGGSKRDEERAKRREERLRSRQEARASGSSRTSRSSSGGYSRGRSSRVSTDPTQLRAILTDGTGSRFALVGERRFKAGDDVEGRRIVEVTGDAVKVEYRQNTYTVRVGEKIY